MSNSYTDYSHDHMFLGKSHEENAKRTLWVVALTVVMMVAEITAGYLTGSMALLADGFHMATHAGALGIAAAAYGYAKDMPQMLATVWNWQGWRLGWLRICSDFGTGLFGNCRRVAISSLSTDSSAIRDSDSYRNCRISSECGERAFAVWRS